MTHIFDTNKNETITDTPLIQDRAATGVGQAGQDVPEDSKRLVY